MYYVLGEGGAKYGPASLETLRKWVEEGRILPGMMLEDASTGVQIQASQVDGLFGPPSAPVASPASTPPSGYSPGSPQEPGPGWQQTPQGGSSYPPGFDGSHGGQPQQQDPTWFIAGGWVLTVLAVIPCCPCLQIPFGIGAIFCGWKTKELGNKHGQVLMSAAIAALAIGMILYGVLMSQQDAMLQMLQEAQRQRNASP
jgi:hypothetical protein